MCPIVISRTAVGRVDLSYCVISRTEVGSVDLSYCDKQD